MRRLIKLALLLGFAFYIGWPAYSGYQIHKALEDEDPLALWSKIDFEGVRASLRPAVEKQVEQQIADAAKAAGPAGTKLAAKLKGETSTKLVDATLEAIVTPENILRIYSSKDTIKDILAKIAMENAQAGGGVGIDAGTLGKITSAGKALGLDTGKLGGLFGGGVAGGGPAPEATAPAAPSEEPAAEEKPKYGLGNIKGFGLNGPLGLTLGLAKDPAATEPDITAEMSFTGTDWKLSGLRPRI